MRQAKQYNWVLKQLTTKGKVSRNTCLDLKGKKKITRLAHYINLLRKADVFSPYVIKTVMTKTANGQDCVYKVVKNERY